MSAILYIRVSTDEQADKGYSQRNQDEVLHKYCVLKSILVQEVFYEDHSAKTFNRPQWQKMLNGLKRSKGKSGVNLVLFTKWDRFSRNTADAYQMIGLLRSLSIEPQAIEQPLDLSIPENKMMLAFYLAVPEVENDRRALNVFHGMRRAKKEGRWIATAPTGYINRSTEDGRKFIRPAEPQAGIMKQAFAEIATGRISVEQVWKKARKDGLRCGKNNFWNLIRNPIYCGKIVVKPFRDETLQVVDGQHEPIITEELFCRVQDVLDGKKSLREAKTSSLAKMPLRGFLVCPTCGRLLTGSSSKGRSAYYDYYHCSKGCRTSFKAEAVHTAFAMLLKKLIPKQAYRSLFKEIARDIFKQQTSGRQNQRLQMLSQLEALHIRLKKALELLMSEAISADDYQQIKKECDGRIASLETDLSRMADMGEAITQLLNRHSNQFLNLTELYDGAVLEDKRKLVGRLFPENACYDGDVFNNKALPDVVSIIFEQSG
ncbi:recombinase family protein [Mucilaginibacter sp. BJC16-A38]|uniref:recombinase family protein n=1 Tax=Mucilaginibacter phenanthrenivorans TaxID=1234842 RepID=UPI00215859C3|nr:recombinase family protein [Mucilaginibacter phenanthrenivorans]MCR8557008.1 recombinase family protein [Mucilaginibacter phenanthrenivorans]